MQIEFPKAILYCGLEDGGCIGLYWRLCMKHFVMLHILWTAPAACFMVGCMGRGDIAQDFQNEDPQVRIAAIRRAGRENRQTATPYLVDRLTDSEAEVRMFAISALKEITGLTHGYRHYDKPASRMLAVEKWRNWLVKKKQPDKTQPVEERKAG